MGQKGPGHPYEIQAQLKNSLYLRFQKNSALENIPVQNSLVPLKS